LSTFKSERANQIEQSRLNNIQVELGRKAQNAADRDSTNQWERVCNNCNLNSSMTPGGRDLTRMKTAMLNRKADLANTNNDGSASMNKF